MERESTDTYSPDLIEQHGVTQGKHKTVINLPGFRVKKEEKFLFFTKTNIQIFFRLLLFHL